MAAVIQNMPRQTVSCGACQHFEKKCIPDECFWAPYFPPDNPDMFIKVHNTFKASNVKRILSQIHDPNERRECVRTLAYEAEARLRDPVYGCMGYISHLEQALANAEKELASYVNVGKNILLSQQMNYNQHHVQHQQMMMGGADQSSSSNYIVYGAAGTTYQQTQMDPSSSASGLPPFTSVAPSQTQLIREQSQQHEVGMETQQYYAAVAATDYRQEVLNQLQQLERQQSSHDLMQQQAVHGRNATARSPEQHDDPTAVPKAATNHGQELLNQLQQLHSHDLMQQQAVHGRNATARSPEKHDPTAVPKAATNHRQELLNQLQQLHSHDLMQQQAVHGRNATARSPEQHDPTAVPKTAHGDATAPESTTEIISWDSDEVEAALYEIEKVQAEEQEEVNFSK